MLIDVPVTVVFDCDSTMRVNRYGDSHGRTFMLRYDTEDTDAPARYTAGDPQNPAARWVVDKEGIFFELMSSGVEAKISARAAKYPADYCADQADGERRQIELDDEAVRQRLVAVGDHTPERAA